MTSYGDVQYPQYPFLNTAPGYTYDDLSQSRGGHSYRHPVIPMHDDPYTSSGSSGYGDLAPSGYGPPNFSSHSGPSSTGYSAPIIHEPHPPSDPHPPPRPTKSTVFGGLKKGGSSAMSALTLLSFLFFVNMLQNCLKEHMDTMNPTVMVLTNGAVRNRNSKLTEMNSREQNSSPESTLTEGHVTSSSDHVNIATTTTAALPPPATIAATLSVSQNNMPITENVYNVNTQNDGQLYSSPALANMNQPNFGPYDSIYRYSNRSDITSHHHSYGDRYNPENDHNDRYLLSPHYEDRPHRWSHHGPHLPYGHSSADPYWDRYENRHFPNHDTYEDTPYLRIY